MAQPSFGITTGTHEVAGRWKDSGIHFYDLHFADQPELLSKALNDCDELGLRYILNFERAEVGWTPSENLKKELRNRSGFMGIMLDEADHMQINAHWPVIDYYGYDDRHFLAETEGLDLLSARQVVFEALQKRGLACSVNGKKAIVEFLFPVMMHTAARAGLHVSPKILKETCGPVMLAAAMGAARQYGVDFWVDVDCWWHNEAIGHSVDRFRSAVLLAYWSGASNIYIEGGWHWAETHPVTLGIEKAYREFICEYAPSHPRPYTWRDFQPEIAIIRFDDTCFDIRQTHLGEYPGPLYGHVLAQPENTEWLNIWSLLSHGFIRTDSASHQWEARRFNSRTLFIPLNNVVVYDYEVGYEPLAGVRLIFLSGPFISPVTYEAVQRKVQEGAICVLPPRLAPDLMGARGVSKFTRIQDGSGAWILLPEFYQLHYECFCGGPLMQELRESLQPFTGDGDRLVYNFGNWKAEFCQAGGDYSRHEIMTCFVPVTQAGADPDRLEVQISRNFNGDRIDLG
ncbi:MAG: hypothetical protein EHM41_08140 [Chloroflexi bacterium]|nr:MAG: hypothetical protein EHM41_08140 [Chloroflexota bacterium]